jgi:DNA-binding TFAR19-related protein (PDSD5 family)
MSEEKDIDIDIIMRRKLLELQRKASQANRQRTPKEVLLAMLYDRGDEVLEAAEKQYPAETKMIVEKLADLVQRGKLKGKISGGALLWLFRQFGMNVHIETTIRIEKDGKMVSIADKLRAED